MNYEFYRMLDKAKTADNASKLEAIKQLYLKCELVESGNMDKEGSAKFVDFANDKEYNGHVVNENCIVFECGNGSIRLNNVNNGILVEASQTGTDSMYITVGMLSPNMKLTEAIEMGKAALADDSLMDGILSKEIK